MFNGINKNAHATFSWDKLGNITVGRPNLGDNVPVKVYRIFEYALFDELCREFGVSHAQDIIRRTGLRAGAEFAANALDFNLPMDEFLDDLAKKLEDFKMGIFKVEKLDRSTGGFTVTIAEDLDCSGLPVSGEVVCNYDEGFIAGIFESYTKEKYVVREVDCWASGDKVCRFRGEPVKEK